MNSDKQKPIEDGTLRISEPPKIMVEDRTVRRSQAALLKGERKTGPQFLRNQSYARKLARSIRFLRIRLIFLRVTWAPAGKTASLELRLIRQEFRLRKITREMEFALQEAASRKVDPKHKHACRIPGGGVEDYLGKHNRLGYCSRSKTYILWDNW